MEKDLNRNISPILTIEVKNAVETPEMQEEALWYAIQSEYHARRIVTGILSGVERLDKQVVAVVYYKSYRVIIPASEMMLGLNKDAHYGDMLLRQEKIIGNMLGAEIDFVIQGIDLDTKSIVASRRAAMLRKRQTFYLDPDKNGEYLIYEGRLVQARVVAAAEKVIRVEVFGVECSIVARDLSWSWLADARELYHIGDQVVVKVTQVDRESVETISIRADIKSVEGDVNKENLKRCQVQGKYIGQVIDIYKGIVFVHLSIGVNAVAHSCYDSRTPAKRDDVYFVVTNIDEEKIPRSGSLHESFARIYSFLSRKRILRENRYIYFRQHKSLC